VRFLYGLEKPEILLWDDMEAHFNPRLLTGMAEWFSDLLKENKQIVLTTHSLEAARMIAGINEEKAGISLLSLQDNILRQKRMSYKEVEELQESGVDPRVAEPFML